MREVEAYVTGLHNLCQYVLANGNREKMQTTMAEIGVFKGESSEIFSQYFKRVYCIDPFWPGYDPSDYASSVEALSEAEKEFDKLRKKRTNLLPVREFSEQAADLFFSNELFFVYIDACHAYEAVRGDILLWQDKVAPTGFLSGHDYNLPGVSKAVLETVGTPDKVFEDNSWVVSKKNIVKRFRKTS